MSIFTIIFHFIILFISEDLIAKIEKKEAEIRKKAEDEEHHPPPE